MKAQNYAKWIWENLFSDKELIFSIIILIEEVVIFALIMIFGENHSILFLIILVVLQVPVGCFFIYMYIHKTTIIQKILDTSTDTSNSQEENQKSPRKSELDLYEIIHSEENKAGVVCEDTKENTIKQKKLHVPQLRLESARTSEGEKIGTIWNEVQKEDPEQFDNNNDERELRERIQQLNNFEQYFFILKQQYQDQINYLHKKYREKIEKIKIEAKSNDTLNSKEISKISSKFSKQAEKIAGNPVENLGMKQKYYQKKTQQLQLLQYHSSEAKY